MSPNQAPAVTHAARMSHATFLRLCSCRSGGWLSRTNPKTSMHSIHGAPVHTAPPAQRQVCAPAGGGPGSVGPLLSLAV